MRHFNLASEIVNDKGCSHKEPKEQENNNTLHVEEKISSTDNMLIDFGSGDKFGDMDYFLVHHLISDCTYVVICLSCQ